MGNWNDSYWAIIGGMHLVRCETLGHFACVDTTIGLRPYQQTCELNVCQLANHYGIGSIKDDIANPTPVGFVA